jgi:hypothetical protein
MLVVVRPAFMPVLFELAKHVRLETKSANGRRTHDDDVSYENEASLSVTGKKQPVA